MAKFPKFLVATNPMAEPDGVYIYHTQKPRFLAKAEGGAVEVVDDIDDMTDYYGGNVEKTAGLIKRMLDWYKAYEIDRRKNKK